MHSFKLIVFFQNRRGCCKGDIIVINYYTSLVSGMYKLKDSLLFDVSSSHIYFFYGTVIISREHFEAIHYVKDTVFILQHFIH